MFYVVTQHVCLTFVIPITLFFRCFVIPITVTMLGGVCEWRGGMYVVGQAYALFSIKYLHIVVIEAEDNQQCPFVRLQAWTRSCVH